MHSTADLQSRAGGPRWTRGKGWALAAGVVTAATIPFALPAVATARVDDHYRQTNLVSDISGIARSTDANLVNPWGLVAGPTTPWWISDNGTGFTTLFTGDGTRVQLPDGTSVPFDPMIPPPAGGTPPAAPTGVVFSSSPTDFVVHSGNRSGPSRFVFATEDGTIAGWSPAVDLHRAILAADNSAKPDAANGAVYKGLALIHNARGNFLVASNFRAGTVDVFDSTFGAAHLAGSFADPTIPAGFAPFNVAAVGDHVIVTYAKQNGARHDDVAGPGNGFLDVFDTQGVLLRRLASHGALNSPWGLASAPNGFGDAGGDLLVGNFGDGHINVFEPGSGQFRGTLNDEDGMPITIGGLWALAFGNDSLAGSSKTLFFTAGIGEEQHGLFGSIIHDRE